MVVTDKRDDPEGDYIKRRLHCNNCGERFNSYEIGENMLVETSEPYFISTINAIKERKRVMDPARRKYSPEYKPVCMKKNYKTWFMQTLDRFPCLKFSKTH